MSGQGSLRLLVRIVLGVAISLLLLWGSGADTATSKEPKSNSTRISHRTAANMPPR